MEIIGRERETLKFLVMMLLKIYGDVIFSKWRIGEEDAKAPMVMCGYFNLNHAASTEKPTKLILICPTMSKNIINFQINKHQKVQN
jgi:hypothetical protein